MNIWVIKNIRFGYKYTSNKNIRNQIINCLNNWLNELINEKSKPNDILIINGGLFSSNNPSIIAINDAYNFIEKISNKLKVYLINTDKEIKKFDNVEFSTIDIFHNINNVNIIKKITSINNFTIIPYGFIDLFNEEYILNNNDDFNGIKTPNIMQLEKTEEQPGVFVFNTINKKHIFIPNTFSPKHITYNINSIEDLSNINNKGDFIHLNINNDFYHSKKEQISLFLNNLNPMSINHYDVITNINDKKKSINNINIIDTIYNHIDDDDVKKQFDRILNIFNKKRQTVM